VISRSDALLSSLQLDLWNTRKGEPWAPDATWKEIAKQQLVDSIYKKLVDQVSPQADDRALTKFLAVNEKCGEWQMACESWEDELVGCLKRHINDFWNKGGHDLVYSFNEILDLGRAGPGASVGSLGNDFYTKMFSSPLTCTHQFLYDVYRRYTDNFPRWKSAEEFRLSRYGEGRVVEGSRFCFVPKSDEISRLICIEPSLNMFYQLGFGAHLERRLGSFFGIYLDRQPEVNRELARQGSLPDMSGRPDCPVTIDLSSASDSLSVKLAEYLFPKGLVSWLKMLRSPIGTVGGKQVALNMISTMGNGFTFPLETMLFACIVAAAAGYRGIALKRATFRDGKLVDPGNFSVFGDDIIVPRVIAGDVLRLLRLCGFAVNPQKTFIEGPFRESCGRDFYKGHDVRPVMIKSLATQQERYIAINALNAWSAKTGIFLPNAVRTLLRMVRYQPVPPAENDDAGVKVPSTMVDQIRRCKQTSSILYKKSLPRPVKIRLSEDDILYPGFVRESKKAVYNPDGLFMAFLRGDVVSCAIGTRQSSVRYKTKWEITPYWDWFPPTGSLALLDWGRWNTAIYFNHHG